MWPILLSFGPFELRSAAAFDGLAVLAAWFYFRRQRQDLGLTLEDFWGLMLALMAGVFVGGIGASVLLYGPGPAVNLNWLLRGRVPGGSFFGVFWGALIAAFLFCRRQGRALAPIADALGAGSLFGLVFMRIGCLLNGCCFGRPTKLAWGVVFRDQASRVPRELLGVSLHPTQAYEAAGAACIFLLLHFEVTPRIRKGELAPGTVFFLSAALYAVLRFAEDFYRASDHGRFACAGLSTAQLLALLTLIGVGWGWLRQGRNQADKARI